MMWFILTKQVMVILRYAFFFSQKDLFVQYSKRKQQQKTSIKGEKEMAGYRVLS